MNYETTRNTVTVAAWETWTNNGFNLDPDMKKETLKTVQDAVNNAWVDGISDLDWLAGTLKILNQAKYLQT